MLLDSSFLIDLMRGDDAALEKRRELEDRGEAPKLPPGVLFELYSGASGAEERIDVLADRLPRVELSTGVEKEAGAIRRDLLRDGRPISEVDYFVAAAARIEDEPVLTEDDHLGDLDGVRVERYR